MAKKTTENLAPLAKILSSSGFTLMRKLQLPEAELGELLFGAGVAVLQLLILFEYAYEFNYGNPLFPWMVNIHLANGAI